MKWKFIVLLIFAPLLLYGQKELDDYIRYGLENNIALKQRLSDYRRSTEALKEARGLFYPSVSIIARYTRAEGGRIIEFPAGDMLNPVYMTLNAITSSNLFPLIENQEFKFLRPEEHETKIRIVQQVFNPDVYFNSLIKKELSVLGANNADQYRRELIAEIKKAYYNLASAYGILGMLTETRELLLENIRVNKKLLENGKITNDYLYRSEAELSKFDQELQNCEKNYKVAKSYFNFLLNKPLNDTVIIKPPDSLPSVSRLTADLVASALSRREELKKLENYKSISSLMVRMNESEKLPDIMIVADFGYQGEKYQFNRDQDYLLASAVLTWNLFEGFSSRARVRQAALGKQMAEAQIEEARKQIELQVVNALDELKTSLKGITAAENRLKSASQVFRLVNRKYEEGQASMLEFLDARSNLTQAEENLIISKYKYLSDFAELEKTAAINQPE